MAKRVTGRALRDPRTAYRVLHSTLNGRLVQMMPPLVSGARITLGPLRRKYPLPGPLRRGARHLALERPGQDRSEEHTSELQSRFDLVCRLLLEKKKQKTSNTG